MKKGTKKVVKAAKAVSAGKAVIRKKTAGKSAAKGVKKAAPKSTKKAVTKKAAAKKAAPKASAKNPATAKSTTKSAKPKLKAKDRKELLKAMLALRDRLTKHVAALKRASLTRHDSVISPEDGTDVFDRQFALNLASSENESVFEIDEALRRLNEGTYGLCEECGCLIGLLRLKALPFVRACIKCQSEKEKKGRARFRPT